MSFVVFLDACVLYPAVLRDVLLTLAENYLYQIRWSPDVLDELERNVAVRLAAVHERERQHAAGYLRTEMEQAFPDAMVPKAAYSSLIPNMGNDPKDRHVLAAAIVGRADAIITSNLKDFPSEVCGQYGIEVLHPDQFLLLQLDLTNRPLADILYELTQERRPPINTINGLLQSLSRTVPNFATAAAVYLA